jgi:hypothetical protein
VLYSYCFKKHEKNDEYCLHCRVDPPVGLLAWFCQIYREGEGIDHNFVWTNTSLYWLTETVASSARIYYEYVSMGNFTEPTTTPIALVMFRDDWRTSVAQLIVHIRISSNGRNMIQADIMPLARCLTCSSAMYGSSSVRFGSECKYLVNFNHQPEGA